MDEKLFEYLTPNQANKEISQYLQDMKEEPASCILYTILLTQISQAFHLSNIGVTGSDKQNSLIEKKWRSLFKIHQPHCQHPEKHVLP
ncbi:MAG: hypothetical protein AAB876_02865 [Patescibacteria group bacterium]